MIGREILCDESKIQDQGVFEFAGNHLGVEGARVLAEALRGNTGITSLTLGGVPTAPSLQRGLSNFVSSQRTIPCGFPAIIGPAVQHCAQCPIFTGSPTTKQTG